MTVKEVCTVTTKYIWGLLLNNYSECASRQVFETDKNWLFYGILDFFLALKAKHVILKTCP